MNYLIVFLVGGALCAFAQILMDRTKLMPGRIMVLYVCLGAILSAIGVYKPFAEFAKAGATVPLLGFGHLLFDGVKEMIDKEGFIGIFMGGLKSTAVGISAALVFSYLASILFNPKMKK